MSRGEREDSRPLLPEESSRSRHLSPEAWTVIGLGSAASFCFGMLVLLMKAERRGFDTNIRMKEIAQKIQSKIRRP